MPASAEHELFEESFDKAGGWLEAAMEDVPALNEVPGWLPAAAHYMLPACCLLPAHWTLLIADCLLTGWREAMAAHC